MEASSSAAGRCWLVLFLLATALCASGQAPNGNTHGFISFALPRLVVDEGASNSTGRVVISVPLVREVGSTGAVIVAVTVLNDVNNDFFGSSTIADFSDGETETDAILQLENDAVPEGNETFTLRLEDARNGAELGTTANTMELVIRANDEPFGFFQFSFDSLLVFASEPFTGQSEVSLMVTRGPGIFGRVTVDFEVLNAQGGVDDISPSGGQIVFLDGVSTQPLTINIIADDLPENDEDFTIRLVNPAGGALLDGSTTDALVTITENDTPLSFSQAVYTVEEEAGSILLIITRGVLANGLGTVGDLSVSSTVQITTASGTATAGSDFQFVTATVTFPPGSTSQTISVPIVDDAIPEGDESFSVTLTSPSLDAVRFAPFSATVFIELNDNAGGLVQFASQEQVLIGEDNGAIASFTILRTVGTFEDLTVEWEITNNIDNALAIDDFQPARGDVTLPNGVSDAILEIQAFDDTIPEVAEVFTVQLVRVVMGDGVLSEGGVRQAPLVVTESDDVYGLIEWASDTMLRVTATTPRELQLSVVRSGGNIGIVAVDYSIVYLPVGVSDPALGVTTVLSAAAGTVLLLGGQSQADVNVGVLDSAFLESGGRFYVNLTSSTLIGGVSPIISPTVSPMIGVRSSALVGVALEAANGFISFVPASRAVLVQEPASGLRAVPLTLVRSGAYGEAIVTWNLNLLDSTSLLDVGATAATVTIPDGATGADLFVSVAADDEPEINEQFTVQLIAVSPANSQRIDNTNGAAVATVTIQQNDDATGVFSISSSTSGPFFVQEPPLNDLIEVTIVRTGGSLTTERIQTQVVNGDVEYSGAFRTIEFSPGQVEMDVLFFVRNDNIPETNETYLFTISSVDGNSAILGSPTSVSITILANDDYAGVFTFDSSSLELIVDEPRTNDSAAIQASTAVFVVRRLAGLFTEVVVDWELSSLAGADLSPTSGVVTFADGQELGEIEIYAVPDELTELNETFSVMLVSVSGDARLASSAQASLTVLQNDDPIRFEQSVITATEGETASFVIVRGGQALDTATVAFSVEYATASPSDVRVTPSGGVVSFPPGQTQAVVSVELVDDSLPEESERVLLSLDSTTGDAVIVSPRQASLLIQPSDDPNGVFQFSAASAAVAATEGSSLELLVERQGGDFGSVTLQWTAYEFNSSSGELQPTDSDISPSLNFVTFEEGNTSNVIQFTITDDTLPELEETFIIELSIISITGDSQDGARLGEPSSAMVVVAASDDPYGLFRVAVDDREVELAEDVPLEQPLLGRVDITVERTFGRLGDVMLSWEVLPETAAPLPLFTDLLFVGSTGPAVSPSPPRSDTGTVALRFTGQPGSMVTVPRGDHPVISSTGFAISVWLQPEVGFGGMLVAKATSDGFTRFYALELVADGGSYIVRFSFLPDTEQAGFSSVEVSVPQASLGDGSWHSLVLSVGPATASFFLDGNSIGSRSVQQVRDGEGELTVGGLANGNFYTGTLQDVRIYSQAIPQSQVSALAGDAAASALTPISGYLSFPDQSGASRVIQLSSKDDDLPEPSQLFTVRLGNSDGGSRIAPGEDSASLTVLKSDAGNGVFAFDQDSLSSVISEPGGVSLLINRERGLFSSVSLYWEIREVSTGNLAVTDFDPALGELVFAEGDAQETLVIETNDELVPELSEDFTVILVMAVADDNQTSSTPSSGASIDILLSQSNLTVRENDFPYGLIQFVTSPPSPGMTIAPATEIPEISVEESDGPITLYVVRAQGRLGSVSAEYQTQDATATATGLAPDFVSGAGLLQFTPTTLVQNFSLELIDDTTPELGKVFYVNLTNPTGDLGAPSFGIGSSLAVNILPSDDAFGRLRFAPSSLSVVAEEEVGGTPVVLTVTRESGTFGDISVCWEVEQVGGGNASDDIFPSSGFVDFSEGQQTAEISLTVSDDLDPELLEVFTVRLLNATIGASISSTASTATITVQASDHPYGRFVFSPALRPVLVSEGAGAVEVGVTREFGTLGTVNVGYQTLASSGLLDDPAVGGVNIEQLLQSSNVATTGLDYLPATGMLMFAANQTSQSFSLFLQEDAEPEMDEIIFVAITSVELDQSSLDEVDTTVLPSVVPGNNSLAFVVIAENDDARGVVQLTAAQFTASEPTQGFLTVERLAGSFGEVSVQWETVALSADASDFSPTGGTVTFPPQSSSLTLPLVVNDDPTPEFDEQFEVRLVGVGGGARLGDTDVAVVTILASDDPNGALEFAVGSRSVQVSEPDATPLSISLVVQREGGASGVVEVTWSVAQMDGSSAMLDIQPVTDTIQFVSNMRQQSIVLTVLPDDVPEVEEVFVVRLESVTGGARIGTSFQATVVISSNDNPYGVVSFAEQTFVALEAGDTGTSVSMIPLIRSFGTFGDLRVFYTIQSTDPASLATSGGTPALSFFPVSLPDLFLTFDVVLRQLNVSSAEECAFECLSSEACLSFATDGATACQTYRAVQTANNSAVQPGVTYYEKDVEQVQPFYQAVATEGNDFSPTIGQSVVIPQGDNSSAIPVTIVGDAIPELNESFIVTLTNVQIVVAIQEIPASPTTPLLEGITETTVVIAENDDPHGEFFLFGNNGASMVRVNEMANFGVILTVERRGGSIGEVQVRWEVTSSSAVEGEDYAGTGALLTFAEGESRTTLALTILEDDDPERDEQLNITLQDPTGGATVAPGDGGRTLVIIDANDRAAGVVGLAPFSRSAVVGEGEVVSLVLERAISALGVVAVDWEISGSGNVSQEFMDVFGTAIFDDGANSTLLEVGVEADATPEVEELYTLRLTAARTLSADISPSGAATLDSQATIATISIGASNNPHGVVEFQSSSLVVLGEEGMPLQLTVIRQFGAFGTIEVSFMAETGSLAGGGGVLGVSEPLATAGQDFVSQLASVRLLDGQQSTVISVPIIDDDDPELMEVFLVRLVSVVLVGGDNSSIPPSLGTARLAEVTIAPNDSPQGELTFLQESYSVEEDVGVFELVIERQQGVVGDVSVIYFVTNEGAVNGPSEDFLVEQLVEVEFPQGETRVVVAVLIIDDTTPEVEEAFCVQLQLPRSGAVLGNISRTCVTILPNDDAYGVFNFAEDSLFFSLEEAGAITTPSSVAELRVQREAGLFGQVTVPYLIEPALPGDGPDLSTLMGALVFNPSESFRVLQVVALSDDVPEIDELYTVMLLDPSDIGRLATNDTMATILIAANQDPSGVIEIIPTNNAGSVAVEEGAGYIEFEVRRSFGAFGEVSVTLATQEGTAVSTEGTSLALDTIQPIESTSAEKWYQFSVDGRPYLALASSSVSGGSMLYSRRGVFTPVQALSTNGATAFTSLSVDGGRSLLVVANGGSPGNREVNSVIYEFVGEEQVQVLQFLPTTGASDVVSFQSPAGGGAWYLVIASREDNAANPNVDTLVLRWNGTAFEPSHQLATIGASALDVFSIEGTIFLAVTSMTDTRSEVYVWMNGQFRLDHTFDTQQASDVAFLSLTSGYHLAVTSESSGLSLFRRSAAGVFTLSSSLSASGALRVEASADFLLLTNSEAPGQLFEITNGDITTVQGVSLPAAARHLLPFSLDNQTLIAAAIASQPGALEQSVILEVILTGPSADFFPRDVDLTFAPGESSLLVAVEVVNDATPEVDEIFDLRLVNPVGGARLGPQSSVAVTILSNDNAHGLLGFAQSSLSVIASELQTDSSVTLQVERSGGTFGQVRASWEISGEHATGEITPISDEVVFAEGQSVATITLTVAADIAPELSEVTRVILTGVVENGVPPGGDQSRGAQILPSQREAVITIQANDAPHGVVVWSADVVTATEEDGVDSEVTLTLFREFGSIGMIVVSYSTLVAGELPVEQQALPLLDFVPTSSETVMADGVNSTTVSIGILHDNTPELAESFLVNITGVRLADEGDREGSTSSSPRTNPGQSLVEVQISENDNSRGVVSFIDTVASTEEEIGGSVSLTLGRTGGAFGVVGVTFSVVGVSASGLDFSPNSGTVFFEANENTTELVVNITNDSDPEFDEVFQVTLLEGEGGAVIGAPVVATVTILSNDDINGVFSFTDSSLLILLPESLSPTDPMGLALLTVQRARNIIGEVTVFWEVEESGRGDLEPDRGNLTFAEGVSLQSFQVRAVNDGVPEVFEAFSVTLTSIEGGGRIVDPREARIAIQASNDPSGVVGFDQYPQGILLSEGEELVVRLLRSGTQGTVTVTWALSPADISVFVTTSDTVVFTDGQSEATFTVQTLSDQIPEVARLYSLQLISSSLARVDVNASEVEVFVRASDSPHGVVEFTQPVSVVVDEVAATIQVDVVRTLGLVGPLRVNFTLLPLSASLGEDFSITQTSYIIIPDNVATVSIDVTVIDDIFPEIDETFSILLDSVELSEDINGGRDFEFPGDPSLIDLIPTLGTNTQLDFTISANDDPFGSISLSSSLFEVAEGETAVIRLVRSGGDFGTVTVGYATMDGTAVSSGGNIDFVRAEGIVIFAPGQTSAEIMIPIIDDTVPEIQENFIVSILQGSTATLGAITTATVIIDTNDDPFGVVGFQPGDVAGIAVDNPDEAVGFVTVSLTVVREGGSIGRTDISWEVVGPFPGMERLDLTLNSIRGTLTLSSGQSSGVINIDVLATSDADEPEETFVVRLLTASSNVLVDPQLDTVSITVLEKGQPFGVISFLGDALSLQTVTEEEVDSLYAIPLTRSGPAAGSVDVSFIVTRSDGSLDSPSLDVSPASGVATFDVGMSLTELRLDILADGVPELNETYSVSLTQPTGGAAINTLADTSSFVIVTNDEAFGSFGISSPLLTASTADAFVSRTLSFTITRSTSAFGSIQVQVQITFDPDPSAAYVTSVVTQTFAENELSAMVSLPVVQDAYLAPDDAFTIAITSATVLSPAEYAGVSADISPEEGSVQLLVSEEVANPIVYFEQASLNATVIDSMVSGSNVALQVVRRGRLGVVSVSWATAGLPGNSNGDITPPTGSILLGPQERSSTINLTATPREPHGEAEVFAVQLAVTSLTPLFPARVNPSADTAFIEPQGVLQLASDRVMAAESDQQASILVWRRFGSLGDIQVTGVAMVAPSNSLSGNEEAAVPNVDFSTIPVSVTMAAGTTSAYLNVSLVDNSETSSLKLFSFALTGIQRLPLTTDSFTSPRLASPPATSALVTILDDEGGSGLFQLSPSSLSLAEGGPAGSFTVQRTAGSSGAVTVLVSTRDGPATGSDLAAVGGSDYTPISQELVFADGDTAMTLSVSVLDDSDPEPLERFRVFLSAPLGGAAIIDTAASTLDVSIPASDNPLGVFSFATTTLTLSEDQAPTAILIVERTGANFSSATVTWEASYPPNSEANPVPLSDILLEARGSLLFQPGITSLELFLQLRNNSVPAEGETFVLEISSDDDGIAFGQSQVEVTVQARMSAVFQFQEQSRMVVATSPGVITLEVERTSGLQLPVSLLYATDDSNTQPVSIGELSFSPAAATVYYTSTQSSLTFEPGVRTETIPINVIDIGTSRPVAFYIDISTLDSDQHVVQNGRAVVVLSQPGAINSLYTLYFNARLANTTQELETVSAALLSLLLDQSAGVTGEADDQANVTQYIIDEIVSKTRTPSTILYTDQLIANLLDIFQAILSDTTFSRRDRLTQSMQRFAYSLVEDTPCPDTAQETSFTYTRSLFYLEAIKAQPLALVGRRFSSSSDNSDRDFLQFPPETIVDATSSSATCLTVHFIEFFTERLFLAPTLSSKVFSVGIQEPGLTPNSAPFIYRVYTPRAVLPGSDDCLMWQYGGSVWESSTNVTKCSPKSNSVLEERFIECRCTQLGALAVNNDVFFGYGWTYPAGIAAAIVLVVMILVILLHLCYLPRTQLATRILICLCISVFLFQLMVLVDVFASDSAFLTDDGCAAMGALVQLTVIAQFIWILALAIALWINFMGFTDGREPLILYVLLTWGASILIVVATILIGRFAVGLELNAPDTGLYGRTGDICFMPLVQSCLLSTALPIILSAILMVALLSHSCVYWSHWEDFHSLYHDSFNKTEIPLLLVFFALIFLTAVAGCLHLYISNVYTFGAFVALNVIQGVYTLVVYFFVSWHTLTAKHKKFAMGDDVEPLTVPNEPSFMGSMSSLASSRKHLAPEEEWEEEEKRTGPNVQPLSMRRLGSEAAGVGPAARSSDNTEDSQLDDLMFMLKTQTYSSEEDAPPYGEGDHVELRKRPLGDEHLELRRISIADTHL